MDIILDLNMWDEAERGGTRIDSERLTELLGAPVCKTIGHRRIGMGRLVLCTLDMLAGRHQGHRHPPVTYGHTLDDRVTELAKLIRAAGCTERPSRWYAVGLLEESFDVDQMDCLDPEHAHDLQAKVQDSVQHIRKTTGEDGVTIISDGRYGYISGLLKSVLVSGEGDRMAVSRRIDNYLTNRYFGFPLFLAFIWLLFQFTFVVGQYPADWLDQGISWLATTLAQILPSGFLAQMLTEGVIAGAGSVLVFLPNILILFLGIAVLEDSGYMARAAFLMDRLMRTIGLQGKAFIPMLMGFGCNVPAVMATRTLESSRQRVLTVLLIPFMSCAARLPVYVLFASAFFAHQAGNVVFLMYILGVLAAIGVGRIFKVILFKEQQVPFVMELPPYRVPTVNAAMIHMWERGKIYLKKVGGVILIASVVLWFLGEYPKPAVDSPGGAPPVSVTEPIGNAHTEQLLRVQSSYIGRIGTAISPALAPLGFNWQLSVALLTGFIAKEVVVSSMGVLYHVGEDVDEKSSGLIEALRNPANGITPLAAFAFMVFVLLYTPCVTVLAAVRREIGGRWVAVSVLLQLVVAWVSAWIVYQGGLLIGLA